jgi:hypothetical protein
MKAGVPEGEGVAEPRSVSAGVEGIETAGKVVGLMGSRDFLACFLEEVTKRIKI